MQVGVLPARHSRHSMRSRHTMLAQSQYVTAWLNHPLPPAPLPAERVAGRRQTRGSAGSSTQQRSFISYAEHTDHSSGGGSDTETISGGEQQYSPAPESSGDEDKVVRQGRGRWDASRSRATSSRRAASTGAGSAAASRGRARGQAAGRAGSAPAAAAAAAEGSPTACIDASRWGLPHVQALPASERAWGSVHPAGASPTGVWLP